MPELRARLGQAARASAERYLSPHALSEVWNVICQHVWWGEPMQLETTQHFNPTRTARAFTEDPARAEFWPVAVDDLMPEIEKAIGRLQ